MSVSMGIATLLMAATLSLMAALPGWLLARTPLFARLGLSWRVGAALVLASLSILFSDVVALAGYRLDRMLVALVAVIVAVIGWWLTRRRERFPSNPPVAIGSAETLFYLVLVAVFIAPAFVLYLPLDTDAQGFGHIALMVREGGTIDTLAPWHPDIQYLYSPALFVWWAFLSDLLQLPLHQVMLPFSHLMAGLLILLGIDLGEALLPERPRARWLLPATITLGLGLFLTLMDSAYTSVAGFLFVALFLILAFRSSRQPGWPIIILAAIALAAVPLTHPDTIIILLIGYIPFYATFWLTQSEHRTFAVWARLFILVPGLGIALTLPWLARVWPLFFAETVVSPFLLTTHHIRQLTLYHGLLIPLLALPGLVIAVRRRTLPDVLMLTWVIFLFDFAMFGLIGRLVAITGLDIMRYVYPFSVAWHGPILAYPYLASRAVDLWLERHPVNLSSRWLTRLCLVTLFLIALALLLQRPFLRATKPFVAFNGAFSSPADLAAMDYLRRTAPADALILNYPHGFEAHWVPVIAERETVEFRGLIYIEQPFFYGIEPDYARQQALTPAYFDPAAASSHTLLGQYGVDYIIYPQIMAVKSLDDPAFRLRWRWPAEAWYPLQSSPAGVSWLELVFEQDGAQVWRVLP